MISSHDGGLRLVAAPRGRASLRASSTTILETSSEREPCGGFGGPRARERRAEWWVGGPAHARVGGFGFSGLHVVGWSVWLQQLGGVGSRMAAILSVRCCSLSAVVSAKVVLDNCLSVVCWVKLQLRFVFPIVVCV
jgi:hypothetical protein